MSKASLSNFTVALILGFLFFSSQTTWASDGACYNDGAFCCYTGTDLSLPSTLLNTSSCSGSLNCCIIKRYINPSNGNSTYSCKFPPPKNYAVTEAIVLTTNWYLREPSSCPLPVSTASLPVERDKCGLSAADGAFAENVPSSPYSVTKHSSWAITISAGVSAGGSVSAGFNVPCVGGVNATGVFTTHADGSKTTSGSTDENFVIDYSESVGPCDAVNGNKSIKRAINTERFYRDGAHVCVIKDPVTTIILGEGPDRDVIIGAAYADVSGEKYTTSDDPCFKRHCGTDTSCTGKKVNTFSGKCSGSVNDICGTGNQLCGGGGVGELQWCCGPIASESCGTGLGDCVPLVITSSTCFSSTSSSTSPPTTTTRPPTTTTRPPTTTTMPSTSSSSSLPFSYENSLGSRIGRATFTGLPGYLRRLGLISLLFINEAQAAESCPVLSCKRATWQTYVAPKSCSSEPNTNACLASTHFWRFSATCTDVGSACQQVMVMGRQSGNFPCKAQSSISCVNPSSPVAPMNRSICRCKYGLHNCTDDFGFHL